MPAGVVELRLVARSLASTLDSLSAVLVKEVKKKDRFLQRHHRSCDVITAVLHALSPKTREYPCPGAPGALDATARRGQTLPTRNATTQTFVPCEAACVVRGD